MLTGLLLGAGASYEAGMGLVWDLTHQLKAWLTPVKLRKLNEGWRSQGGGYPDELVEELVQVLELPDLHYESILGFLETQFRRPSTVGRQRHFHGLYGWLVELVYWILYFRHTKNVPYIKWSIQHLNGIVRLAEKTYPLWIFSLNHDLIIECVAAAHAIPLNSGATSSVISLPRRNRSGVKAGELRAEVITEDQLKSGGMAFWQPGTQGINLLKIHGSLDIFTFRDGKDLLKFLPVEKSVEGVIEALRVANDELVSPTLGGRVTNEIVYDDDSGVPQFLRRSLLAGAFKFDNRSSQVLPTRVLDYFKSYINYVSTLICIGYGFGDVHVNQVLRDWLEFSGDRHLEIVGPGVRMPSWLLHLSPQVTLKDATATDYFDLVGGITRTKREVLEKNFAAWVRQHGDAGNAEFAAFLQQAMQRRIVELARKIAMLPVRTGDVDLEAVGLTPEEFVKQHSAEFTIENLLEAFLSSRGLLAAATTAPGSGLQS